MLLLVKGMLFFSVMGAYTSSVWKLIDDYFNSEYRAYVADELARSQNAKLAHEAAKMLTAKSDPEKRDDMLAQKQQELDAKIARLEQELTLIQNIKSRSAINEPSEKQKTNDERPTINNNDEKENGNGNFHTDGKLQIGQNEMKNEAITSKEKINYKSKKKQQQLSGQQDECQQQTENKGENEEKKLMLAAKKTRSPKSKIIENLNPYQDDDDETPASVINAYEFGFDEIYDTENNLLAYWRYKHSPGVEVVHEQEYCVSNDFQEATVCDGGVNLNP